MDPGGSDVEEGVTTASLPAEPDRPSPRDDVGFAGFYERELPGQVRRAALLTGDADTADDLVHDAFVAVYQRWGRVEDPGPYLSTAVLNRCRDHARRTSTADRRMPLLVERGEPDDEVLWDALQALPFNHRAALVLRFYLQLPEREIADLLGCRPGSVGPWIQRGLRSLRKALS
jgi:RNA polymerase sigma factor (sigma-70 family)